MASQYSVVNRKMSAICQVSGKFFDLRPYGILQPIFLSFTRVRLLVFFELMDCKNAKFV